jgi:hypothetical protein
MAHKSPTDRLVLPYLGAQVPSRKQTVRDADEKKNPNKPGGSRQTEMVAAERIFKELAKIGKALGAIENAIRENTQALQAMEFGKPTVVIRKERT